MNDAYVENMYNKILFTLFEMMQLNVVAIVLNNNAITCVEIHLIFIFNKFHFLLC